MSEELKIQHDCFKCAERSKWHAENSEDYDKERKAHDKKRKWYAEECRCKEKPDE